MTTGYIGYITAFDGITLHNGTTKKALTPVGSTSVVNEKIFTLPNGTVINYDGTTDSSTSPGRVKVDYVITSSAYAEYDGLQAKKGNRGTVTKTKYSTGSPGTETCTGVLVGLEIIEEKSRPKVGVLFITLEFAFEDDWA